MALAGLDVGTSGCKFTVYSSQGKKLHTARRSYTEFSSGPGYRELDPVVVLENVLEAIQEGCAQSAEPVEAFAITSMGESTIVVDQTGKPLHSVMVTGDARGIEESRELLQFASPESIMASTGVPPSEMYSLPKWMWLSKNTNTFQKAAYLFLFEDYITWYLTGQRKVSYSSAARTMAFDVDKKCWNLNLIQIAGVRLEMLSQPVAPGEPVGEILSSIASQHNLPAGITIVAGGHDQNMATLGAGVNQPDIAEDGLGTCEVLTALLPPSANPAYMMQHDLVRIPYVYPNTYLTYIVMPTMGVLMNWTQKTFFPQLASTAYNSTLNPLAQMDQMIGEEPGHLLVLPQFGASGIPHVDYDAKGLIWGLTVHTTGAEIYRAVLEGMSFQILMAHQLLEPLGIKHNRLRLTGGGSNSRQILQMRADIFGIPVEQMDNTESGTAGCMILAGKAMGKFQDIDHAIGQTVRVKETFLPNFERHKLYRAQYEKYKSIYQQMHQFK